MRAVRVIALALGVAGATYGLWLMLGLGLGQVAGVLGWVVGGIVVHDGFVAPVVVVIGVAVAVRAPTWRAPLLWTVVVLGTAHSRGGARARAVRCAARQPDVARPAVLARIRRRRRPRGGSHRRERGSTTCACVRRRGRRVTARSDGESWVLRPGARCNLPEVRRTAPASLVWHAGIRKGLVTLRVSAGHGAFHTRGRVRN